MFFEQITEFELRRPGPPRRTCTLITAYFHNKTKIFTKNFRVDCYLLLKYSQRQCALLSIT